MAPPTFLVEADNYKQGCEKVERFLDRTLLIHYDNISCVRVESCSAADKMFRQKVQHLVESNKKNMVTLIEEIQESGFHQIAELAEMKQGFESKLLHTLVHLVDGFIGVDSVLYNLIEDSHHISETLHRKIEQTPNRYWLIHVEAENPQTLI